MAATNKIQSNTPSAFSLQATSMNYLTSSEVITSYTKAKREVDPDIVYRFGDQDLGVEEIFTNLGQTKGVESITFEHYEEDWIRELVNVESTTGGSATETNVTIASSPTDNIYSYGSPNFYNAPETNNKYGANIRENDIVEIGSVKAIATNVSYGSSTTFDLESLDGSDLPAGETELIIMSNGWAEETDQPQGRETRLVKYSNNIQIIKDAYKVTGSAMGQMSWVNVNGENKWYLKGIADTRKNFSGNCELTWLTGEKATSTSSTFNSRNTTEGLIPAIENYGVVESWTLSSLTLDDFANVADALAANRGSKENMVLSGIRFKRELSDLLRNSDGLKAGGVQYAGLGGEKRAVDLGFESFTYSDYTFHSKTLQAFNDPKSLGASSSKYKNYAVGIPTGNITAFDIGQEKINTPAMSIVHQEVPGEDMGYYEWITGAAGGAKTNENDSMKINMRKRTGLELYGLGRFFVMTA